MCCDYDLWVGIISLRMSCAVSCLWFVLQLIKGLFIVFALFVILRLLVTLMLDSFKTLFTLFAFWIALFEYYDCGGLF